MAGRGRGRGRGLSSAESRPGGTSIQTPAKIDTKETKHPIPAPKVDAFDELCGQFKGLKLSSSQEDLKNLVQKAKESTNIDENCFQIIDILYQKVFNNNEFAEIVAQVGNQLCCLEENGGKFRSCLLKRAQEHYKNRDELCKDSEWTGLLSLLCQVFRVLRISGAPLKPLAVPIYEMMGDVLLNIGDATKIECFYQNFKDVGKLLQDIDKRRMDSLLCKLRDSIISKHSASETRCLLIELLELQASNWLVNQDTQRFYSDAMADILAAES